MSKWYWTGTPYGFRELKSNERRILERREEGDVVLQVYLLPQSKSLWAYVIRDCCLIRRIEGGFKTAEEARLAADGAREEARLAGGWGYDLDWPMM